MKYKIKNLEEIINGYERHAISKQIYDIQNLK
jgi:hypothetical protein